MKNKKIIGEVLDKKHWKEAGKSIFELLKKEKVKNYLGVQSKFLPILFRFEQATIKKKDGEFLKLVEEIKNKNPYPKDIFIEPQKEQYKLMRKIFKENGLTLDAFFGTEGRRVWNNCCEDFEEELK